MTPTAGRAMGVRPTCHLYLYLYLLSSYRTESVMSYDNTYSEGCNVPQLSFPLNIAVWHERQREVLSAAADLPAQEAAGVQAQCYEHWPWLLSPHDGELHPSWDVGRTHRRRARGALPVQALAHPLRHAVQAPEYLVLSVDWTGAHVLLAAAASQDEQLQADIRTGDPYSWLTSILATEAGGRGDLAQDRPTAKRLLLAWLNGQRQEAADQLWGAHTGSPPTVSPTLLLEDRYPAVAAWLDALKVAVEANGWHTETLSWPEGRRDPHRVPSWVLQALEARALGLVEARTDPQGRHSATLPSGAQVRLIVTLHDETVWLVRPEDIDEAATTIRQWMYEAIVSVMPHPIHGLTPEITTSATWGPSWGDQGGSRIPPEGIYRNPRSWGLWARSEVERLSAGGMEDLELASAQQPLRSAVVWLALTDRSSYQLLRESLRRMYGRRASHLMSYVDVEIGVYRAAQARAQDGQSEPLARDDHQTVARRVGLLAGALDREGKPTGTMISSGGTFWAVDANSKIWVPKQEEEIPNAVGRMSGYTVQTQTGYASLCIDQGDRAGVTKVMHHLLAAHDYFSCADRPPGARCLNGYLVVPEDGEPYLRPYASEDRVRQPDVLQVDYSPDATCPLWLETLRHIYHEQQDPAGHVARLQEWMGAAICGQLHRFARALWLVGKGGRNGKSTIIEVVRSMYHPTAVASVSPHDLAGDSRPAMVALSLAAINACHEVDRRPLKATSGLKAIIAGEAVQVRRLYAEPTMARLTAPWIMGSNDLPQLSDDSGGLARRFLVLRHDYSIPAHLADLDRVHRLQAERAGILRWAIEGWIRLRAQRDFTPLEECDTLIRDKQVEHDSFQNWLEENTTFSRDVELRLWPSALDLYRDYREWAEEGGERHTLTRVELRTRLLALRTPDGGKPYVRVRNNRHPRFPYHLRGGVFEEADDDLRD